MNIWVVSSVFIQNNSAQNTLKHFYVHSFIGNRPRNGITES